MEHISVRDHSSQTEDTCAVPTKSAPAAAKAAKAAIGSGGYGVDYQAASAKQPGQQLGGPPAKKARWSSLTSKVAAKVAAKAAKPPAKPAAKGPPAKSPSKSKVGKGEGRGAARRRQRAHRRRASSW